VPVPSLSPQTLPSEYVWRFEGSPYAPAPVMPVRLGGLAGDEGGKVPAPEQPAAVRPPAPLPPYIRAAQFDQAELCEPPPPASCVAMPADVRITQDGNRIRLTSPNYQAHCDRIRGGANGQFILEGNVQLTSRRHGQTMTISAQRVMLNVKDNQFIVEQAEGMESSRVNVAPVGGVISCEPAQAMNEQQREEARRIWLIDRMLQQSRPDLTPFRNYRNNNPEERDAILVVRIAYFTGASGPNPEARFIWSHSKNRRSTFAVICATPSSTTSELGQQIDPAENTIPRFAVSKITISAPPLSGLRPFAKRFTLVGELLEILSVSWPDAPPGQRMCRLFSPKRSPSFSPVPANAQCDGSTTR